MGIDPLEYSQKDKNITKNFYHDLNGVEGPYWMITKKKQWAPDDTSQSLGWWSEDGVRMLRHLSDPGYDSDEEAATKMSQPKHADDEDSESKAEVRWHDEDAADLEES